MGHSRRHPRSSRTAPKKSSRKRALESSSSSESEDDRRSRRVRSRRAPSSRSSSRSSSLRRIPVPTPFPDEITEALYLELKGTDSLSEWIVAADELGLHTAKKLVCLSSTWSCLFTDSPLVHSLRGLQRPIVMY